MKALKYALYAVGALVVVLVVVVVIVAALFDPNAYKPQLVQLVKERTGRTLSIHGDIGLKLFPKIGAAVGKTTLSERASDKEFAGVDGVQVYLALLPLLSRQVVVDEVRVNGLRANLIKFQDGQTNFADLTGGGSRAMEKSELPKPTAAPRGQATPQQPVKLDISGIRITSSRITWRDETNGNDLAVEVAQLKTGRLADRTPSPVELDVNVKGVKPKADLQAKLTGTLTFDLQAQEYSFKDLNAKLTGSALDFSGIAATLKTSSIEAAGATQAVKLAGLDLDAKASRGKDSFDVKSTAPNIQFTPVALAVDALTLSATGTVGGMTLTDVKLKLSTLEGSAKALKIAALTLDVDAKAKDNAVKGMLSTPVSGNLEARIFELPKIAADFTITSPSIPQKTVKLVLSGAVRADLGKERVVSDIVAKLDESTIKAKLGMTKFSTPAYDFDIDIDKLNVDRYMPPKQKSGTAGTVTAKTADAKTAGPNGKQAEQPIDLSPLKSLNLDGRVKIGNLVANNVKASSVRVDVRAKDGRLDVSPMQANLYQGSLKGSASVNANTSQIAVKQVLSGISIGPLLRDAMQMDLLDGKGNVVLDVTTAGSTVTAFKKALGGAAALNLKDGAIKGIDLAGAIRNVKARLGAGDAEQAADQGQKTDFSELTASFTISNGVAHNGDLSIKSPFLRISGEGDVNIGNDSLDYVVKAAIVATTAGQGGKGRAELSGLTLPVRVYGPYAGIKHKLEYSQMLSGASKEALKEAAKEMLKGSTKGQLQDLGKQLLGGEDPAGAKSGTAAPGGDQAQPAAPAKRPEDQIKDKLKSLLR